MKRRKNEHKTRALAAANRTSYLGLALGAALAAALLLIAISVVPIGSPRQMVLAQVVRGTAIHQAARTNDSVTALGPGAGSAPAIAAPDAPLAPSIQAKESSSTYLTLGFDKLSAFTFFVTDQMVDANTDALAAARKTMEQIPHEIKILNEKEVSIRGFMLPIKYQAGLTTEFLLLKNQGMCCYGTVPKITEWVNVRMAGKGVKVTMDVPVTVCGTFHVGEVREGKNGDLVGIYRLDADKVTTE